jgi:DNA-binding transcriptional regulator YhcF (GntR family)
MRLTLDRESPLPLHEQLAEQIRLLVETGELAPRDRLPTIKEAARELTVNHNTVAAAYRKLEREGYLAQRKRAGTTVAERPPRIFERALAGRIAAETAQRALLSGVATNDLIRALAAQSALERAGTRLRVAVLAENPLRASECAEKVGALLGAGFECVPLIPGDYVSVEYHLTVVDPELTTSLSRERIVHDFKPSPPAFLNYGPEFPAAAD